MFKVLCRVGIFHLGLLLRYPVNCCICSKAGSWAYLGLNYIIKPV